jgi:hypothetical protein
MAAVRCSMQEPHYFHGYAADVEVTCSGQARCGVVAHPSHTLTERRSLWCPGICDCGMGRGLHGQGEHK